MTEAECAEVLGVPEDTVSELVRNGVIQYTIGLDFRPRVTESIDRIRDILARRSEFLLRTNKILDNPWGD